MKIIDRIFDLMEVNNIRPVDLANELNVSKGVVSNWKRRNTNPPVEYIESICNLLGVSIEFLVTGKSSKPFESSSELRQIEPLLERLNSDSVNKLKHYLEFLLYFQDKNSSPLGNTPQSQEENTENNTAISEDITTRSLPMKGYIAAGHPIDLPDEYTFSDMVSIPTNQKSEKADFALQVKGDSMEPEVKDGDIILVKMQCYANDGQIVVASIDHSATLKKLYRYSDRVELHSINKKYPPIIISNENINFRILGVKL